MRPAGTRASRWGALAAVLLVALSGACSSGSSRPGRASPTTVPPPTTALPTTTSSSTIPLPSRFRPLSATFVSTQTGWVLGDAPCGARRCPSLLATADGGRSWRPGPKLPDGLPTVYDPANGELTDRVRFADLHNGWIFGQQVVWATHDGGRSWRRLPMGGRQILLEAGGGSVWFAAEFGAAGGKLQVERATVGADDFRPAAGAPDGGVLQGLTVHGRSVWLTFRQIGPTAEVPALSGSLDGRHWSPLGMPCPDANRFAVAASSSTEMFGACSGGGAACQYDKDSFVSHDGGRHWVRGAKIHPGADPVGLLATASPSVAVMASQCAASELFGTFDGGRSWDWVDQEPTGGAPWLDLGFTDSRQGFAVLGGDVTPESRSHLLMTRDGGRHWKPVDLSA